MPSKMIVLCLSLSIFARDARAAPDPELSAFLTATQTVAAANESFNYLQQKPRSVEITGMTVLIDPTSAKNTLYADLNNRADIKTLTIHADQVTIRGHLALPQTTVKIFCRRLLFEDPPTSIPGFVPRIKTTPIILTSRPTPEGAGINGLDGLPGGDITIYNQFFTANTQDKLLLDVKGSDGQPGGLGRNGNPGGDLPVYKGSPSLIEPYPTNAVWIYRRRSGESPVTFFGVDDWPENGENAVRAGIPGVGGAGGTIAARVMANDVVMNTSGAPSGAPGTNTVGGAPGKPVNAGHYRFESSGSTHYFLTEAHTSVKGNDAEAPGAPAATGPWGSFQGLPQNEPTMHPRVLKAIDAYTTQLMAGGERALTVEWIDDYLGRYVQFKTTTHWTLLPAADKQQAEARRATLEQRRADALKNYADHWTTYR